MFNSNADQSKKVIDTIMKQKIKLEEEVKPLNERIKKLDADIVEGNDKFNKLQSEKTELESYLSHT